VHAVEDGGQGRVPQAALALEVEDAHGDFALAVVGGRRQLTRVRQHGCPRHRHAQHRPVLLRCVLEKYSLN